MAPRRPAQQTTTRRAPPQALRFVSGPWRGTRITNDPLGDAPDLLTDATNMYAPDVAEKAGMYAIPGFSLLNNGVAVTTSSGRFTGQGAFSYTSLGGVTTNFVVFNGKLYRGDATLSVFTDVSPAGITIDNSINTRVYGTSFATQLIVTDGVNPPWLATNLASTPITGTNIDYDLMGTAWSAFGPFVVYGGSAFCILNTVGGVSRRSDISWSVAADASTGWQQTNYDNNWTLLQTVGQSAPPPIFALCGTDVALYYWRELSIGAISGPVGPNLASTATHDAVSYNIGTQSPQCVVQYGQTIYFIDQIGRPYQMVPGLPPTAVWLQFRQVVEGSSIGYPTVTRHVSTGTFEPTLNLWIGASWSPTPSAAMPPTQGYIFDGRTGQFFSRFQLAQGVQIEAMGNFLDASGRSTLIILGSVAAPSGSTPAASGYVWGLNALATVGDFLTTMDGSTLLITEAGDNLTTEGNAIANWMDGSVVKVRSVTSPRFGYDIDTVLTVDRASALLAPSVPVQVSMQTASVAQTIEGTPSPSTVQDGIARLTVGASGIQGRGVRVTLSPTTAATQWSVQQITCNAVANPAPPDEP